MMMWPSDAWNKLAMSILTSSLSSSIPGADETKGANNDHVTTIISSAKQLSRAASSELLQQHILPASEYAKRTNLGRQSQGVMLDDKNNNNAISAIAGQDPRLAQTYGEFPLDSLDTLLDRGLMLLNDSTATTITTKPNKALTVVDLGSGCGRLAIHMALTRANWRIHGIELSKLLHDEALAAQERAIRGGWLLRQEQKMSSAADNSVADLFGISDNDDTMMSSRLFLHHGAASAFPDIIRQADLIFCYSTAFASCGFSPVSGTMLLGEEWNDLLTEYCDRDCIVITTDKSLDPHWGWTIVDRIDVPNPEVFESTGFIQQCCSRRRQDGS